MWKKYGKYILMGVTATVIVTSFLLRKKETGHPRDYDEIIRSGVLRVVTEYNSISFFIDGDSLGGFHYDLIRQFAHDKGLKAEIIPEMSFEKRIRGLENGTYDMIANSTLITIESKDSILFTHPLILNKQVLVQRKPIHKDDTTYISSQLDLARRTLHVIKGSPAILRIRNLGNEIGDTIYINEIERYGSEQLLAMVAHGDIDYAVCDESIALASIDSLPQLDIRTDISFNQFYAWGVSKHSPVLLDSLNVWLDSFIKSKEYQRIHRKYYKN